MTDTMRMGSRMPEASRSAARAMSRRKAQAAAAKRKRSFSPPPTAKAKKARKSQAARQTYAARMQSASSAQGIFYRYRRPLQSAASILGHELSEVIRRFFPSGRREPAFAALSPDTPEKIRLIRKQLALVSRTYPGHFFHHAPSLRIDLTDQEAEFILKKIQKGTFTTVATVIHDSDRRVLLTQDKKGAPEIYRIPSGTPEPADRTVEGVALREMREELGRRIKVTGRIGAFRLLLYHQGAFFSHWFSYLLAARLADGSRPLIVPSHSEVGAVRWGTPGEGPLRFSSNGSYAALDAHVNPVVSNFFAKRPFDKRTP